MRDHRAVALNTLFQQRLFGVKLSLKNGGFQEVLSYWKGVANVGTFPLVGYRKSTIEDMVVENYFFVSRKLA